MYRRESLPARLSWVDVADFETFVLDPRLNVGARNLVPTAPQERVIVLAGEVIADSELGA